MTHRPRLAAPPGQDLGHVESRQPSTRRVLSSTREQRRLASSRRAAGVTVVAGHFSPRRGAARRICRWKRKVPHLNFGAARPSPTDCGCGRRGGGGVSQATVPRLRQPALSPPLCAAACSVSLAQHKVNTRPRHGQPTRASQHRRVTQPRAPRGPREGCPRRAAPHPTAAFKTITFFLRLNNICPCLSPWCVPPPLMVPPLPPLTPYPQKITLAVPLSSWVSFLPPAD